MVLLIATCTSVYKQAPIQPFLRCLCLLGGAFSRILYFDVQTGTKTSLFIRGLVVNVYGMVLLIASSTSVYKMAPIQPFLSCLFLLGGAFLASCTSMYKQAPNKPI